MKYTFSATVNYLEQAEVYTPTFKVQRRYELMELFIKLIKEEPEATSYVITVCKVPN